MKRWIWLAGMAGALCAGAAPGAAPTEREIEEQLLPVLLLRDIADLRMAGLAVAGGRVGVSDLAASDQNAWEPGSFEVRFRVFLRATDDLYAKAPASRFAGVGWRVPEDADDVFVLVERKGADVSVRYRFETERKGGRWVFAKEPHAGAFEWPGDVQWPVRTRGCWEEWGRQMGKTPDFFESERDAKRELERRHGKP